MWFDDSPKKPTPQKIAEAIVRYRERFGVAPSVVLTNEAELCAIEGVLVRAEGYVRRGNFWIGAAS